MTAIHRRTPIRAMPLSVLPGPLGPPEPNDAGVVYAGQALRRGGLGLGAPARLPDFGRKLTCARERVTLLRDSHRGHNLCTAPERRQAAL